MWWESGDLWRRALSSHQALRCDLDHWHDLCSNGLDDSLRHPLQRWCSTRGTGYSSWQKVTSRHPDVTADLPEMPPGSRLTSAGQQVCTAGKPCLFPHHASPREAVWIIKSSSCCFSCYVFVSLMCGINYPQDWFGEIPPGMMRLFE